MKVASYEDAWLRENDQTHRPGWNLTLFKTVRIDLCLQLQLKVQMHIRNLDYYFLKIHFLIKEKLEQRSRLFLMHIRDLDYRQKILDGKIYKNMHFERGTWFLI